MPKSSHRRAEPFFRDEKTHDLIERIADTNSLTIFAGAGISLDRGSLTWDDLVVALLAERLRGLAGHKNEAAAFAGARVISSALGPVAAASAVRELYQREREFVDDPALMQVIASDMYKRLYPRNRWSPGGALAEAIVRLAVTWKSYGKDVAILTTNYDNNLEDFAGDVEAKAFAKKHGIAITPRVNGRRVGDDAIPVYHLNGFIPHEDAARGNLAFSETGLALGSEVVGQTKPRLDWRLKLIENRLSKSTTLFVGTSFRDPTVVEGLIRTAASAPTCPRYGVFPYQGDAWCDAEPVVRAEANAAFEARLAHLKVEPVRPDFYGQVAQLLNEVMHCRVTCGGKYRGSERYSDRLTRWWSTWSRKVRYRRGPRDYQDKCQEILADTQKTVAATLKPRGTERLKLELWIRSSPPNQRHIELWGSSIAASRTVRDNVQAKIENQSDYAAVRAFCQGFDLRGAMRGSPGRWQSHFSVPIVLQNQPWHRMPVGVISLLSTQPENASCLRSLDDPAVWEATRGALTRAGRALLDPDVVEC
jgi:hypothetical protein